MRPGIYRVRYRFHLSVQGNWDVCGPMFEVDTIVFVVGYREAHDVSRAGAKITSCIITVIHAGHVFGLQYSDDSPFAEDAGRWLYPITAGHAHRGTT